MFCRHMEYGNIFVCWFMHFPFIVVTDPEMVKVWRKSVIFISINFISREEVNSNVFNEVIQAI